MKKYLVMILFGSLVLQSCFVETERSFEDTYYSLYDPVVMSRQTFESSLGFEPIQRMVEAGKIYVKDSYVFIVDKDRGIHIYKKYEGQELKEVSYFKVPGATDIAIRNNIFYINQATDLIAVKMNIEAQTFQLTKRIRNIFPDKHSPDGYVHYVGDGEVVVGWESKRG